MARVVGTMVKSVGLTWLQVNIKYVKIDVNIILLCQAEPALNHNQL